MKLSFRGHQYESHQPHLEPTGTERIGTYRGAPLKVHTYNITQRHEGQVELIYRGVKYTHDV